MGWLQELGTSLQMGAQLWQITTGRRPSNFQQGKHPPVHIRPTHCTSDTNVHGGGLVIVSMSGCPSGRPFCVIFGPSRLAQGVGGGISRRSVLLRVGSSLYSAEVCFGEGFYFRPRSSLYHAEVCPGVSCCRAPLFMGGPETFRSGSSYNRVEEFTDGQDVLLQEPPLQRGQGHR